MASRGYIVAVRRDRRKDAPADWLSRVRATEGVTVVGSSGERAQVNADDAGVKRLRRSLGAYLRIEPVVVHRPN